ncbi:MAG TPA: dihydrolipoamide acetyltransferase family protein [Phycisphaerae bacterium]|nr:dihydrolipoamide acetyltransferase family protein [Phycisphaerae bacterium]
MIQRVTLPALGETVDTSTIERWLKKEGDAVKSGDILCEITTDKATLEVESYYTGTLLKIVAAEGNELPVGALIAVVGDPGEAIPEEILTEAAPAAGAAAPAAAAPEPTVSAAVSSAAAPPAPRGRLVASPRARRTARELGIALDRVQGTGPGGRIVEADVVAVAGAATAVKASPVARKLAERQGVDLAAVRGTGPGGKVVKADVLAAAQAPAVAPGTVIPLTAMRRIVAERMLHSKQTIPCYYLQMDADMTDLAELRSKLNAGAPDGKVSFNDFIIKAAALALKAFPQVNSRWVEGGIERRGAAHVGLAVGLDEGLIVPVVRNADTKTLRDIACETTDFAQRARSKRLLPDEYQDGCLTVSNLGMFGIRNFIPVVNPGESAILGLGVIQDRAVCRQGGIHVRKMMSMTLSVDHRLVDGAVGAQFLEMIRDLLEAPQKLTAE